MTTISDDFNRANSASLGANWTEVAGDADIVGNEYNIITAAYGDVVTIHNTALSSADQYVKLVMASAEVQYPMIYMRYTNSSSAHYRMTIDGNNGNVDWEYMPSVGGSSSLIVAGSLGSGIGGGDDSIGITIEGTGTSTVVRGWRNPTANAPGSASLWDGNAPAFSLTTDPGTPVNTGNYVGIGGQQGASGNLQYGDFYAGDFGGAAQSQAPRSMHQFRQRRVL